MKTLLNLILIAYTFAAAGALICQRCFNENGDTCTEYTEQTCDDGITSCVSTLVRIRFGKEICHRTWKECASHKKWCEMTYNMSFGQNMDFHSTAYCCEGDNCNQGPVKMAPIDETPNGMECPSCFTSGKSCKPKNAKCVGTQTRCYSLSGHVFRGGKKFQQLAIQGCGSSSVCQKPIPPHPVSLLQEGFSLDCKEKNY